MFVYHFTQTNHLAILPSKLYVFFLFIAHTVQYIRIALRATSRKSQLPFLLQYHLVIPFLSPCLGTYNLLMLPIYLLLHLPLPFPHLFFWHVLLFFFPLHLLTPFLFPPFLIVSRLHLFNSSTSFAWVGQIHNSFVSFFPLSLLNPIF